MGILLLIYREWFLKCPRQSREQDTDTVQETKRSLPFMNPGKHSVECSSSEVITDSFGDSSNEMATTVSKEHPEINSVPVFKLLSCHPCSPVSCMLPRVFTGESLWSAPLICIIAHSLLYTWFCLLFT